jgi:cytochrome P450 family 142 subfamily A polypeptide 1
VTEPSEPQTPQRELPQADWNPFIPMPVKQARAAQADIRAQCPVAQVAPGLAYVFAAKEARSVLLDSKRFSNVGNFGGDPSMPPFVTLLDPPEHTEVRTLLNNGFSRDSIVQASPWIQELVASLIDSFQAKGKADIVHELAMPLTERVISRLVGIPPEDSSQLARWSLAITAMLPRPRFDTEDWLKIERYITNLLNVRAASSATPDDMITRLVGARVSGRPLNVREITGHIWLIFVGGLESTAYTLSTLVHQLLADRAQWERLVSHRELLAGAVEEGIRFTSPLRALERQVAAESEIAGCPVKRGTTVFVGLESANFDEGVFGKDSETFRMDRGESARHISFGLGRHTCLGAPLARNEITTALNCLMDKLPTLRLAPGFKYETAPSQFSNVPKSVEVVW